MENGIPNWLFQLVITIGVVGASAYLFATNQQIPEALMNILVMIVGFYFGAVSTKNLYTEPPK